MNKKTLLIVIVCAVILLALVCLLIGALSGQMPWDDPEDYAYNPYEETTEPSEETEQTTEPSAETEETTQATEPEETKPVPTTQPTLPDEDKVQVDVEVQVPTTPSGDSSEPTQGETKPTEKDTSHVDDPSSEQVAGKDFWDLYEGLNP